VGEWWGCERVRGARRKPKMRKWVHPRERSFEVGGSGSRHLPRYISTFDRVVVVGIGFGFERMMDGEVQR